MTLNQHEARILTVLIKAERFMTTAEVARKATMSWNTAEKYLTRMHEEGWLQRKGKTTGYWKAILDEYE